MNAPQVDGTTALHWAARNDDLETADILIRAGAKVTAANLDGATPLLLASINGSASMIAKLLVAGADPDTPLTASHDTALMIAARPAAPMRSRYCWITARTSMPKKIGAAPPQ